MRRSGERTDCVELTKCIEPSSNGKTPDFGSGNRGSNPRGSTNTKSNLYNSAHKMQMKFAVRSCSSEGWVVAPTGNWFCTLGLRQRLRVRITPVSQISSHSSMD